MLDKLFLIFGKLWRSGTWRERMLRLNENLLEAVLMIIELVVNLVQILEANAVGNHLKGFQLALLDLLHQFVPVLVYGCLTVANQSNSSLHQ